jgi:hypothetical protein
MQSGVARKTYGTVSADRENEMSGLEFVQRLADGTLPLNMIAQTLGYDVAEAERGRVVVTVVPFRRSCSAYLFVTAPTRGSDHRESDSRHR